MVTMVFGLPVPADTDHDSFTIFNNPVNYLYTFWEMATDCYDWTIYLETTFKHEGSESRHPTEKSEADV
ncbi:MAG: hypothetical protein JSV74_02935 [Dehalococcoidia bacterium]|nr:MAG: hypothetical protein JSV74_02935 [Dehalococcoidia bacterium]